MDAYTLTQDELQPAFGKALSTGANFAPNLTVKRGTILALITAAIATATYVLTFTGPPNSGTFTLKYGGYETSAITYSATAATMRENIRKALVALPNVGDGNMTLSGTGPFTITGAQELAGLPITAITIGSQSFDTGSIAAAPGTTGVANNRLTIFDGTLITAPTTAPTVSGTGTGGSWAAGAYSVCYTYKNSVGESTPSYVATTALTSAQQLRVAAITSIPDGVTHVQIYVNGARAGAAIPVSSNATAQTDIAGPGSIPGTPPPTTSTLYKNIDGSQTASAIAVFDFRTDNKGRVIKATADHIVSPSTSENVYRGGAFRADELVGLTAKAVADLGAKWRKGSLGVSGSILDIPFAPVT